MTTAWTTRTDAYIDAQQASQVYKTGAIAWSTPDGRHFSALLDDVYDTSYRLNGVPVANLPEASGVFFDGEIEIDRGMAPVRWALRSRGR